MRPEVQKLAGTAILCFHGEEEHDTLCRDLPAWLATGVPLKGSYHVGGDYATIAGIILREAKIVRP